LKRPENAPVHETPPPILKSQFPGILTPERHYILTFENFWPVHEPPASEVLEWAARFRDGELERCLAGLVVVVWRWRRFVRSVEEEEEEEEEEEDVVLATLKRLATRICGCGWRSVAGGGKGGVSGVWINICRWRATSFATIWV
jgi:hypothetical protein